MKKETAFLNVRLIKYNSNKKSLVKTFYFSVKNILYRLSLIHNLVKIL